MTAPVSFLVDANVFIQAKNRYYAFAICPGFWNSLLSHFESGHLFTIDFIKQELLRGRDDLADWVNSEVPDEFFKVSQEEAVIEIYEQIILWINRNPQFYESAKADFAASADGWLLAFAQAKDMIVVTQEQLSPGAKNRVPIPNVCEQFGIQYKDTFFMLKALKVEFEWKA